MVRGANLGTLTCLAAAIGGLALTFAACGYPEATFMGDPSGVGGQGTGGVSNDGGFFVGATTSTGPCTDKDKDGVCVETGDCDDDNPNVRPGQTAFFTEPRPNTSPPNFDYNCNGADDKEFAAPCSPTAACPSSAGFALDVACGESGSFGACTSPPAAPTCVFQSATTRIQACH